MFIYNFLSVSKSVINKFTDGFTEKPYKPKTN
jgi:hypothetical protein